MILFLDDNEDRHTAFSARWCAVGNQPCHHVRTAQEAIDALNASTYTAVFLDHDLSYEDQNHALGEPTRERTGMAVVDHLVRMCAAWTRPSGTLMLHQPPEVAFVHSLNYDAAAEMSRRLLECGYFKGIYRIPFHMLIQQLPQLIRRSE